MLIKKKNGTVLRVSLLFQSPPQSLILLAIPLNPCCVQTTPSKVRAPLEQSLPSTSVSPIFRRLLILIFIPFSFPRLSNFGNHRLDFLSPYSSFMTSVQFLGSILSKPSPPITAVLIPFIYCHCWRSPLMFLVLHTLIICSRCFMLFHFVVDESVKERSNPGESIESIVDVKVSKIINKHIYRWRFIQILSIQCKNIIPKD